MEEETGKRKKSLSTEPYKGVRDFYPEDMAAQNYIFDVWRKVVEQFGYREYGASILEPAELYRQKTGDEIVNDQMYVFKDKGDREVALRPEMTPSLARMVAAKRKSLKFPLRWFTVANCFRYERPQRGRRREHWQLNCDLLGVPEPDGDIEIIRLAYEVMRAFGAEDKDFVIKISNREWLDKWFEWLGLELGDIEESKRKKKMLYGLLDVASKDPERFAKGVREVRSDLTPAIVLGKEIDWDAIQKNLAINAKGILDKLKDAGVKNVVTDLTGVARGFDYYTGMVFEVFDTNPENRRSLFGGGRYDNLLEMFGVPPVPTVGFGMGDVTIRDFLETHGLPLAKSR